MSIFYAKSTNGFYDSEIHGNDIPVDAVAITAEEYAAVFEAQAVGKMIAADANGNPVAIVPPPPPPPTILEQIVAIERTITDRRRDEAILGEDGGWLAARRNEIALLRSQL
ncbi:MAG: hypothetical protein SFW64_00275 [Alphaproteobacteria bacterium]|nr:hypothetical protein [Alphaproteobacteria bacterium]